MLDLKLVRENPELVKAGIRKKHRDPALVDRVLEIDRRRRELVQEVERLRAEQNRASGEIAKLRGTDREPRIAAMRDVSSRLKTLEPELREAEAALTRMTLELPNLPHESVPPGKDATENVPVRHWGEKPRFDFQPLDHLELGTRLGLLDMERGAKVSGSRFYFLRGAGALLELALMRLGMDVLLTERFTPIIPPVLVRPDIITGAWGGAALDDQQVYRIADEELALIGTSEQPLAGLYKEETLDESQLPLRLAGISWCFRREAGSYGRDVKGIYRVHQFDKVEMFSFTQPDASWDEHEYLVSLHERVLQRLGLHYRVVAVCGGDSSTPSAKTYDVETWMPGRREYGETSSVSNCTDFQARRLGIRVRRGGGAVYAHTLNGTAVATSRALVSVLEHYQQKDGTVRMPEALVPYMNGMKVITPP